MNHTARTRSGVGTLWIECNDPAKLKLYGLPLDRALRELPDNVWEEKNGIIVVRDHNAYVRSGARNSLAREFGISGSAIAGIGVASSTSAVTVDTRFGNGASAGLNGAVSGQNVCIKAFSPAASLVADGAGVVQVATGGATFTNSDFFNNVPFVWNKLFLTLAVPASNANEVDGNLVDVIGGTGGSSPYNKSYSQDLSNVGGFSVTAQIAVTATAV